MVGNGGRRGVRRQAGGLTVTIYLVNIQETYAIDADDEDDALQRARGQGRLIDSDAMAWEE